MVVRPTTMVIMRIATVVVMAEGVAATMTTMVDMEEVKDMGEEIATVVEMGIMAEVVLEVVLVVVKVVMVEEGSDVEEVVFKREIYKFIFEIFTYEDVISKHSCSGFSEHFSDFLVT